MRTSMRRYNPIFVTCLSVLMIINQAANAYESSSETLLELATQPAPLVQHEWCDTHRHWVAKRPNNNVAGAICPTYGMCDDPAVRDMSIPDANTPIKTIRVHFVILRNDDGTNSAGTIADAADQIDQMNVDFADYRFQFVHTVEFADATAYRQLTSEAEVTAMKQAYAENPQTQCNVYVADITNLPPGLEGRGTYPFDPDALTDQGGILLDDGSFGEDHQTLTHEMGHNLGLYHTHVGVSEFDESAFCFMDMDPCDCPCYEHAAAFSLDYTGDFCNDTPPTPVNYTCMPPGGTDDCSATPWGPTQPENFMGYAGEGCWDQFSDQQAGRMHCWTEAELASWIQTTPVISNVNASQRTDGSMIVDIYYDLVGGTYTISVQASDDGGVTWNVPITALTGDVGPGATSGVGKQIFWDSVSDLSYVTGAQFAIRVCALSATNPGGMAQVPAGEFEMGDHHDGLSNSPIHSANIDAFYMDRYEVTNQQYADALNWALSQGNLVTVSAGTVFSHESQTSYPYCSTTSAVSSSRITWDGIIFDVTPGKEDHPMHHVTWYGSAAYSNWRSEMEGREPSYDTELWACNFAIDGYRLPTEAEWEKAARGANHDPYYRYPWGNTIDGTNANFAGSSDPFESGPSPYTTPGGYYAPNGYGLYDIAGNVWEWCNDWYGASYYRTSPLNNPQGPSETSARVHRGGSWSSGGLGMPELRCAYRDANGPAGSSSVIGLRLVLGFDYSGPSGCSDSGTFSIDNILFGDINGDGTVDLDDILCMLSCFAGNYICAGGLAIADIWPCGGDGAITLDDILKILAAFAGVDACP